LILLLTPALSSFGDTSSGLRPPSPHPMRRRNYFAGRFPGVTAARQHRANFRSAFSAAEARLAIDSWEFVELVSRLCVETNPLCEFRLNNDALAIGTATAIMNRAMGFAYAFARNRPPADDPYRTRIELR
jgi:hypothetical protein